MPDKSRVYRFLTLQGHGARTRTGTAPAPQTKCDLGPSGSAFAPSVRVYGGYHNYGSMVRVKPAGSRRASLEFSDRFISNYLVRIVLLVDADRCGLSGLRAAGCHTAVVISVCSISGFHKSFRPRVKLLPLEGLGRCAAGFCLSSDSAPRL